MAATEPQVPGPGLPRPAPKKVAMVQAQKVFLPDWKAQEGAAGQPPLAASALALARASGVSSGVSSGCTLVAFRVFEHAAFGGFGVEDGGADLVDAHGPFAQVDAAAAVGAEGEVFVRGLDELGAGGALEGFDFGLRVFGGLRHGCCPWWNCCCFYFRSVGLRSQFAASAGHSFHRNAKRGQG